MNVLVLGSGSREHVIVEKLSNSEKVDKIFISPGNEGCSAISVDLRDKNSIVDFATLNNVYMVVVGPEQYLVDGIADLLKVYKIRCFGPQAYASQIEGSKEFSKKFMEENKIPTADYKCFNRSQLEDAKQYVYDSDSVVLKVSGLAGGKGVFLPDSKQDAFYELDKIFLDNKYGDAGSSVIIEERLVGEEVSVFAFCNGEKAFLMPQAQDYKRIYDDDKGPNTGGMGAIAPVNVLTEEELVRLNEYMNIVVRKLNYVGVLYAGIMKTFKGFYILEFNCRFGDPETQVVLNLLKSDLFDIFDTCINRQTPKIEWNSVYVSNVVLSHNLYPFGKPEAYIPIKLVQKLDQSIKLYFSGVKKINGVLHTKGGRVISMVCSGKSLYETLNKIYNNVYKIQYKGVYFRRDIGLKKCLYGVPINTKKLKIAIFGSTNGTSSEYLIKYQKELNIEISLIVSNNLEAGILEKAKTNNIPFICLPSTSINKIIVSILDIYEIDLVFLIGYMKIIRGPILEKYRNRIFNVHPSLLPRFCGMMNLNVHENVIVSGDLSTGCTLHRVEEQVDCGSIILQKQVQVPKDSTSASLKLLVQRLEKQVFIDFINLYRRSYFFSDKITYETSGVCIEEGNNFVDYIKTLDTGGNIGKFGGIYDIGDTKLCATTDGVGTKLEIARKLDKYDTIGIDLVAMCVNDLIVQGAEPLFFLDYIAVDRIEIEKCKNIMKGIVEGCRQAGCVLLGGETAEMPGVYKQGGFDLAGFSVGKIEKELPQEIKAGYSMYGLRAKGVHSNGFSLIRKLLETHDYPNMEELLEPTIIYVDIIRQLKTRYDIKGLVHITGGGLVENIPRILPNGLSFNLEINWKIPEVFEWIKENSDMTWEDMYRTYNCGIGMVVILEHEVNDETLIPLGRITEKNDQN